MVILITNSMVSMTHHTAISTNDLTLEGFQHAYENDELLDFKGRVTGVSSREDEHRVIMPARNVLMALED